MYLIYFDLPDKESSSFGNIGCDYLFNNFAIVSISNNINEFYYSNELSSIKAVGGATLETYFNKTNQVVSIDVLNINQEVCITPIFLIGVNTEANQNFKSAVVKKV